MSMVHLSVGHESAGVRTPAVGTGDRRAAGRTPHCRAPGRRGSGWSRTTTASATGSPCHRRLRGLQRARAQRQGGFHLHHPARARCFPTADGRAGFFVHALRHAGHRTRAAAADDRALPRPVQHHHLRSQRPLSRRARPAQGLLHLHRRSRAPRFHRRRARRHHFGLERWRTHGGRFPVGAVRHPGRVPGELLPGNQCAGAARQPRRARANAGVEVHPRAAEPTVAGCHRHAPPDGPRPASRGAAS